MISPPPGASSGGGSRRSRYTRSPSGGAPASKRSKPSSSTADPYDRNHGSGSDQNRLYTSICVKNMNPKISDLDVRELCNKKFSKYGTNSVKIYHKNQERVAFVNFTNCEDAKKARHAKTGLVWENMRVTLEPVYYRRTVPAEQPLNSGSPNERSPPHRRHRRSATRSPSPPPPPPVSSRGRYSSSSRHPRAVSPPRSPPPMRSSRPPRRPYSPYIPLPPDLADYVSSSAPSRNRHPSSPSPARRHHHKHSSKSKRSRSPNSHRSASGSPVHRAHAEADTNGQSEPTRTLLVENLERDISESKLNDIFGRYGTIDEINLKKSSSSSKRAHAFIEYENVDMAHKARQAMNGHLIGKVECKIRYGKLVPSRHLWVGNIAIDMKRRDLEHAFARYGQIKTLDYGNGDPTAIITYSDTEDAVTARTKLVGTLQLIDGQIIRDESTVSPSLRRGFRIDYLVRPTTRRFVIVRPQYPTTTRQASPSPSPSVHSSARESSVASSARSSVENNGSRSASPEEEENFKTEARSPSPATPSSPPSQIKQRRSTEQSPSPPPADLSPIAGRSFYAPIGSYLSPKDTANVHKISDLMDLCEELNLSATQNSTALSTVYPVQFILKSHAYDARMHFLAGSPTLASVLLGQPGDLVAAKTGLKITQRLRLDQHKLDDLERNLRSNVTTAISMTGHQAQSNLNGQLSMTDDEILVDLENFNDAMVHFKEAVDEKDLERMPTIFNQLLTILKHIIQTYRLIDSVDVLEYAAKLIHLLQDLHSSDKTTYDPEPFSQAIDQLALCLTARITNRLILPTSSIASSSNPNDSTTQETSAAESDVLLDILLKRADGIEIAHEHAKHLSKYMFSLIHYVQERSIEELEHAERTSKLATNCSLSSFLNTYQHLPAFDLMIKTLKHDATHQSKIQSAWLLLQTHEFVGKLDSWRTYHDNIRKAVKIQWDKCLKKFQQANQAVLDARSNSKSVINLPTSSSSSSSNSSDPVAHSTNPSMLSPHGCLQRTSSSPPIIHGSATAVAAASPPLANDSMLQSNLVQFETKRQELHLTKQESLMILNKLISNTENVITDALNTYFRLTDSLYYSSVTYVPRSSNDFISSYAAYVHSLPQCPVQDEQMLNKDNSSRQIPIVIRLCCRAIEQLEGHKIKGIYRLSGVKSKVDHLCRQFVHGTELTETDLTNNYSAIVLANAVKKYLRELPIPLLFMVEPSSSIVIQSDLMSIGKEIYASSQPSTTRINERLRQVIEQRVASDAKEALIQLLQHLHLISLSEQENQMSAANLGIVFGPTLFKSQQRMQEDTTLSTLLEAPYQAKLIEYLIVNVHELFDSDI